MSPSLFLSFSSLLSLIFLPLPLRLSSGPADIFSLFASESGSYATREDMEAMLQAVDGEIPTSLRKCFSEVSSTAVHTAPPHHSLPAPVCGL